MPEPLPPKPAPKPPALMAAVPWSDEQTSRIASQFPGVELSFAAYLTQHFIVCDPSIIADLLRYLRDREGYDFLIDVTAVDYPKHDRRFELIYILQNLATNRRLRIKTSTDEAVSTVTQVFSGANWLEREVYDMFGVVFTGHPDPRRILMPEEWTGFPLRKEYSILGVDENWVAGNIEIIGQPESAKP